MLSLVKIWFSFLLAAGYVKGAAWNVKDDVMKQDISKCAPHAAEYIRKKAADVDGCNFIVTSCSSWEFSNVDQLTASVYCSRTETINEFRDGMTMLTYTADGIPKLCDDVASIKDKDSVVEEMLNDKLCPTSGEAKHNWDVITAREKFFAGLAAKLNAPAKTPDKAQVAELPKFIADYLQKKAFFPACEDIEVGCDYSRPKVALRTWIASDTCNKRESRDETNRIVYEYKTEKAEVAVIARAFQMKHPGLRIMMILKEIEALNCNSYVSNMKFTSVADLQNVLAEAQKPGSQERIAAWDVADDAMKQQISECAPEFVDHLKQKAAGAKDCKFIVQTCSSLSFDNNKRLVSELRCSKAEKFEDKFKLDLLITSTRQPTVCEAKLSAVEEILNDKLCQTPGEVKHSWEIVTPKDQFFKDLPTKLKVDGKTPDKAQLQQLPQFVADFVGDQFSTPGFTAVEVVCNRLLSADALRTEIVIVNQRVIVKKGDKKPNGKVAKEDKLGYDSKKVEVVMIARAFQKKHPGLRIMKILKVMTGMNCNNAVAVKQFAAKADLLIALTNAAASPRS